MEFIYKTDKLSYQKIIKKYKKIKIEYKKEKAKLQIKYNYALIDYNYINYEKILNNKNLKSILSKKEIKEIETNIIKFRLVLDKIENLFLTLNLNFSSRENDKINIEKLNQEYYNLYKTDLYEDLKIIDIINEMISIIKLN